MALTSANEWRAREVWYSRGVVFVRYFLKLDAIADCPRLGNRTHFTLDIQGAPDSLRVQDVKLDFQSMR
jgi:hypothetical protein